MRNIKSFKLFESSLFDYDDNHLTVENMLELNDILLELIDSDIDYKIIAGDVKSPNGVFIYSGDIKINKMKNHLDPDRFIIEIALFPAAENNEPMLSNTNFKLTKDIIDVIKRVDAYFKELGFNISLHEWSGDKLEPITINILENYINRFYNVNIDQLDIKLS